ncbi:MAG TPA: NADH-quinone oxidoreductase subunit J [Nitrospirae bacterium]|nr:NADH-quinone oxidoreductase subunit J [Nitrospirota bacterium]HDO22956.1 NADH-quinone oxidoreductase subunit J [Nitrospirota bacterium]HDZ87944.1 NADH-quinone oxidoreductase subunit J [Nitrospirota bacterium]
MAINQFFFGYFAFVIILTALLVVTRKNPVHSVLWMLVMFFHVAGLYLFLNAEFMAAVQIIVYAGAILVLYVFLIFLLNLKEEIQGEHYVGEWPMGLTLALSVLVVILIPLAGMKVKPFGKWSIAAISKETHTVALGKVLYTGYLFPFEVASIILLVAIVGAVFLARGKSDSPEDE